MSNSTVKRAAHRRYKVPPAERPVRVRPISGTFSMPALDREMERGRALMWVAGAEASIASRRTPSVRFAIVEPSKEAHDSLVSVFQCRRTRRPPRREPTSACGPAGHHKPARLLRPDTRRIWGLALTVVGFSPQSRTTSVNPPAMTSGDTGGQRAMEPSSPGARVGSSP